MPGSTGGGGSDGAPLKCGMDYTPPEWQPRQPLKYHIGLHLPGSRASIAGKSATFPEAAARSNRVAHRELYQSWGISIRA
jgi:hypothetical protein